MVQPPQSRFLTPKALLDAQTWNGTLSNATESWNVDANWNPGTFPNAVGASANLSVDLTANKIINLQQGITLGTLTMGDSSGTSTLTIATGTGTNTLSFDAASGNATLATSGGSNTISAGIALTDSVDMTLGSALTISGSISGSGTLNKLATTSGLTLSGNNTGWTGGIVNRQGTINMTGTPPTSLWAPGLLHLPTPTVDLAIPSLQTQPPAKQSRTISFRTMQIFKPQRNMRRYRSVVGPVAIVS
jgi:hypothetical protein